MTHEELRAEIGALTVLPPAEYVAARDARVEQLRAEGARELAAALASSPRPTLPAWAADQLAHHDGDHLAELFRAADRLGAAQAAGRGHGDELRAARDAFTRAVRELRRRAGGHLRSNGSGADGHLDEVEATLLAAAVDTEVGAELRAAALTRPAPSPGFAALAAITPAAADDADTEGGMARTEADDAVGGATDATSAEAAAAARRAELEDRLADLEATHARLVGGAEDAAEQARVARAEADELRAEAARLLDRAAVADRRAEEAEERREAREHDRHEVADELAALRRDLDAAGSG